MRAGHLAHMYRLMCRGLPLVHFGALIHWSERPSMASSPGRQAPLDSPAGAVNSNVRFTAMSYTMLWGTGCASRRRPGQPLDSGVLDALMDSEGVPDSEVQVAGFRESHTTHYVYHLLTFEPSDEQHCRANLYLGRHQRPQMQPKGPNCGAHVSSTNAHA